MNCTNCTRPTLRPNWSTDGNVGPFCQSCWNLLGATFTPDPGPRCDECGKAADWEGYRRGGGMVWLAAVCEEHKGLLIGEQAKRAEAAV